MAFSATSLVVLPIGVTRSSAVEAADAGTVAVELSSSPSEAGLDARVQKSGSPPVVITIWVSIWLRPGALLAAECCLSLSLRLAKACCFGGGPLGGARADGDCCSSRGRRLYDTSRRRKTPAGGLGVESGSLKTWVPPRSRLRVFKKDNCLST